MARASAVLDTADAPSPEDGVAASELIEAAPRDFARRLLFEPSISIAGLEAGYTGPGVKTILPASATAKVDIRLLPGQDPDDVLAKLRAHLDRRGFGAVEIEPLARGKPAKSDGDTPLAHAVLAASRDVFGEPVAYPVAGSGPIHLFTDVLGVPVVMPAGTSRPDCSIHAPNENARADDYVAHVRFTTRLLERLHERGGVA
jgi:acetylornithine deacetylase/succinyl-diaminopimelate desuccinylase-like protein